MATNIRTGKAGRQAVEITGIKEVERRISSVIDAVSGAQSVEVVRDAATVLYDKAVTNAKAVNVPHEVLEDIFIYGKQPTGKRLDGPSALVGLKKAGRRLDAKAYVTWTPRNRVGQFEKTQRTRTRGRGASLVLPGTKSAKGGLQQIGENLGTMWELGTTLMAAKPWFRPAVSETREQVIDKMATGFKKIIDSKAK